MRQLQSGQHFGAPKKILQLKGTILTEAGYVPDIEVPWHYHENAYFYYHLRGRLDEMNKKQTLTCTPGTLLFHHWQGQVLTIKTFQPMRFFFISN